jgi:ubiquinone/menaquinone biosynthesis C-methylase UbiE
MEYAGTICDVSGPLPYKDATFVEVVASHVIEHIEWFKTQAVLTEWARVLTPGGVMKIWTPDMNAVMDVLFKAEAGMAIAPDEVDSHVHMMKIHNKENDPYIWANYRILSAEDPKSSIQYHKPHRSFFTFKHLKNQLEKAGLKDVKRITTRPPYYHGWANMGVEGTK